MFPQGIDLEAGGRNKKVRRTAPKSENVYLKLLVKVMAAALKQTSCSIAMGEQQVQYTLVQHGTSPQMM